MRRLDFISDKDIAADGKPRRKYEIVEEPNTSGSQAATALLMANVFLMLKGVFAGTTEAIAAEKAEENPAPGVQDPGSADAGGIGALDALQDDRFAQERDDEAEGIEVPGTGAATQSDPPVAIFSEALGAAPQSTRSSLVPLGSSSDGVSPPTSNVIPFPRTDAGGGKRSTSGGAGDGPGSDGGGSSGTPDSSDDNPTPDGSADDPKGPPRPPILNRLPVVTAPVVMNDIFVNQSILIAMSDLLRNASDPDADPLQVRNVEASSGTIVDKGDGTWTFTPELFQTGSVVFNYEIADAEGAIQQTAQIDILPIPGETLEGTDNSETIVGGPGSDSILALAGNDVILGREGSDVIEAGDGDDRIVAGTGDDVAYGGGGNDRLFGGTGDDVLFGGPGDDFLSGDSGNDTLFGDEGNDVLLGGSGNDKAFGGAGNDVLKGDDGNDLLDGGDGSDILEAGTGSDILIGGSGHDTASGGDGSDTIIATILDGDDIYDGGAGSDTYDISGTSADAVIDLNAGTASSTDIGNDVIFGIENATGGSGNDEIIANDSLNVLRGGPGDDIFIFLSGGSSGKGSGLRDRIEDFEAGDRIDVSRIDGNLDDEGWQRFTFDYEQASFENAAHIGYRYETIEEQDSTIVMLKLTQNPNDDDADWEIEIVGYFELQEHHFVL